MANCYLQLIDALKSNYQMVMITKIIANEEGDKIEKVLADGNDLETGNNNIELSHKIQKVLDKGLPLLFSTHSNEKVLLEPFYPEARLIILGGGHIAKSLVKFGVEVGFSITVVDDRLSFANMNRFPEAETVLCESFEMCFDTLNVNPSDYVIIVTRGHRHDGICIRKVLNKNPEYLGMIGSKSRVKSIKEQLIREGFEEERVNQICAPIGFEIGGITPEEIAISIIAQVISQKRLHKTSLVTSTRKQVNCSDIDFEVLVSLANDEERRAIITVISTKGSTPRGVGAKMIVWQDGRILGSIGGGCSEAEVIQAARGLIDSGGYKIQQIDMTGDVAEEEGMVCGGIMDVLIEVYPSN